MTQDHELPQFEREILELLEQCNRGAVLKIDGLLYELTSAGGALVWYRMNSLAWWKHHQLARYLYQRGVRAIDISRFAPIANVVEREPLLKLYHEANDALPSAHLTAFYRLLRGLRPLLIDDTTTPEAS